MPDNDQGAEETVVNKPWPLQSFNQLVDGPLGKYS